MKTLTKIAIIDGQLVEVVVCKPSRRRAASSIQKARYPDTSSVRGERHAAREAGQFEE